MDEIVVVEEDNSDDELNPIQLSLIKLALVVTIGAVVSAITEKTFDLFIERRRNRSEDSTEDSE